ncbi:ABC transporter substrate-binding protein [Cohaesibacter intestini]|uniref:ABC transporter substrate-binding protein n=1 Tax=Cohaesibacter intestini TaxID=2211145 RepID=UPI000DE911E9|nr:ABC transporter substrate-binding protein [Cohaesibacter intestini]
MLSNIWLSGLSRLARAIAFFVAFAATYSVATAAPINITDDSGRTLTFDKPLKRAVVFNRYNAEFIRAVADMDVIVGVDSWVTRDPTYWPDLKEGMLVGKGQREPNYEAIIAQDPDVVIFPRNGSWQEAIKTLEPFDIPVVVLTGWDVLKHVSNITAFGKMFDAEEKAAKLNAFYTGNMALLKERLEGAERKTVYLEEKTPYRSVLRGSGWHDMIEAAGGRNIFEHVDIETQPKERGSVHNHEVDPEAILKAQPDMIIKLQPGSYPLHPASFSQAFFEALKERPGFDALPAIKNGDAYHMNYYLAGGCSKMIGALSIAKWLYPDRFEDVDPDAVMKTWLEDFQGVAYPGRYWAKATEWEAGQ